MRFIFVLALLVAWFYFGSPPATVANLVWPNIPAPWESVDAYYYPDRSDRADWKSEAGLETIDECQVWALDMASREGDPRLERGTYECAFGKMASHNGLNVYRRAVH